MVNDLTPICKALIALLAGLREPVTISGIETALPHAEKTAVRVELQMLVRATIVRQAIRVSDERLVYWLAGADVGSFDGVLLHYPSDATAEQRQGGTLYRRGLDVTLADVGGISPSQEDQHG